jgi:hypothetical protein
MRNQRRNASSTNDLNCTVRKYLTAREIEKLMDYARKHNRFRARLAPGTPIEVWCQDEMRVGQKNKLTYRWARKGSRPHHRDDVLLITADLRYQVVSRSLRITGLDSVDTPHLSEQGVVIVHLSPFVAKARSCKILIVAGKPVLNRTTQNGLVARRRRDIERRARRSYAPIDRRPYSSGFDAADRAEDRGSERPAHRRWGLGALSYRAATQG